MKQLAETDVLVVGGGPAGIGAALAAARAGARTLLLERHGFLAGVASYGLGMPINQMRPEGQPRGSIHELIIDRLKAYGPDAVQIVGHALVCNVQYLQVAVMDTLDAAGSEFLLHARVAEALTEGERVVGCVVATKEGLASISAGAIVDATGDADVSYFAGAETMKGREGDGFLSPMTLCLLIIGIDVDGARQLEASDPGLVDLIATARPQYPLLPDRMHFELGPFPLRRSLVINHAGTRTFGVLDGTQLADLTTAEAYSRRQAIQIVEALRAHGGAPFARVQLAAAGPQVGVRETRRIKGGYVLTEEDAMTGRTFSDGIAWRSGLLDIGFVRLEPMKVHEVPYRALLPEKIEGLLVAGRCISATHVAASAGKSMGNCVATGHAAGLAAALAVSHGCMPRDLPVSVLQEALRRDGVRLGASTHT